MAGVLPRAPISRIIREAGADRVSDGATEAMAYHLERFASEVASVAVEFARHAGRKTVTADDVDMAVRVVRGL